MFIHLFCCCCCLATETSAPVAAQVGLCVMWIRQKKGSVLKKSVSCLQFFFLFLFFLRVERLVWRLSCSYTDIRCTINTTCFLCTRTGQEPAEEQNRLRTGSLWAASLTFRWRKPSSCSGGTPQFAPEPSDPVIKETKVAGGSERARTVDTAGGVVFWSPTSTLKMNTLGVFIQVSWIVALCVHCVVTECDPMSRSALRMNFTPDDRWCRWRISFSEMAQPFQELLKSVGALVQLILKM